MVRRFLQVSWQMYPSLGSEMMLCRTRSNAGKEADSNGRSQKGLFHRERLEFRILSR